MALPDSREETATAAAPVDPNTINAIQDAIIAAATAEARYWQTCLALAGVGFISTGYTVYAAAGYGIVTNNMNVQWVNPLAIECRPGDVITALHVRTGVGTSGAVHGLTLTGPGGGGVINAGAALANDTTYTIAIAPFTVPADYFFGYWQIEDTGVPGNSGNSFVAVGVTKHRPL